MNATEWVSLIVSILTGLAAAIPLAVQLVKYVQKAVKEKNWNSDAQNGYGLDGGG